ncbi:MAG: GNAT family N-acetyltransferase [Bacteroidetes bacterium]|nr:GNAT family N-acetyltransferase [Bacteroidota bacterium]
MQIRKLEQYDVIPIIEIVRSTGVFRDIEINVARELLEIAVDNPQQGDYIVYTAVDEKNQPMGYYCVGPTPLTVSTFDLYWIAVHPRFYGMGIGHALLTHCEEFVKRIGGTLIIVETSSTEKYERTRKFYTKHQYKEVARIPQYYAPGDDLILYSKYL